MVSYSEGTASSTVTRDAVGRVATIAGSETTAFTYDWAGQLTGSVDGSGTRSFGFDSVANVTAITVDAATTAITFAANGEISNVDTAAAVYDGAGRATSLPLPDGTMIGTVFDARGLPVTVTTTPATGSAVVETRVYDGDRRLAAVTVDDGTGAGAETYDFVWDISTPVPQIVSWTTSNGSSEFVYGASRVAVIDPTGTAAVFSQSALGDTVSSVATAGYAGPGPVGPYGETGASPQPRFGDRSELVIGEQTHLRARDLVNDLGRFATTDPLDGVDGSATVSNRYQYGDNTPPNARDPLGLRAELDAFLREVLAANDYNNRLRNDLSLIGADRAAALGAGLYNVTEVVVRYSKEFIPGIDCYRFVQDPQFGAGAWCLADIGGAKVLAKGVDAIRAANRAIDALKHGDDLIDLTNLAKPVRTPPKPSAALDEILNPGPRTMGGSFLPNGSTVRYSETAAAIGDDPNTLQNLLRSQGNGGHDVIVHGGQFGGETRFVVDGVPIDANQIADAILNNPNYSGGPINLVTCGGSCGPADERPAFLASRSDQARFPWISTRLQAS